jgi:hypothetical protein
MTLFDSSYATKLKYYIIKQNNVDTRQKMHGRLKSTAKFQCQHKLKGEDQVPEPKMLHDGDSTNPNPQSMRTGHE